MIESDMNTTVHFPSFKQYNNKKSPFSFKALRFYLRCFRYRSAIAELEKRINASPITQTYFKQNTVNSYPLVHSFLNLEFNTHDRLHYIVNNVLWMHDLLGEHLFINWANGLPLKLATLTDEFYFQFGPNDLSYHEGYSSLSLRNREGRRIFSCTFSLIDSHKILITSIQGARGDDAQALVKASTKALYGLRPQQLIILGIQAFCRTLDIPTILCVAHHQHIRQKNANKRRVFIHYDQVWQEYGAIQHPQGYWVLPTSSPRKSLDEIESKKRSQYRKRYAMLDAFEEQFKHSLSIPNPQKDPNDKKVD